MKLIIGLGNPEPEYSWTRHNVGKDILNQVAIKIDESVNNWKQNRKILCDTININQTILAKPTNYMNESGIAVRKILDYYDIKPEDMLVIYDELDLSVGNYKLGFNKGSRIHNGILSIKAHINEQPFWHLKVGVRDPEIEGSVQKTGRDPSKYVLSPFTKSQQTNIKNLTENSISKDLINWLSKN